VAAEKHRDLDTVMNFFAPDVIIQGEAAPAMKGIEAARSVWKKLFEIPYTDIADVEPRTVVVSQSGDLAYDVGSWKLTMPSKSGPTKERG
jgi:ketosteroid isomerase-like protein